ncbi:MAG: hypothetical protein C9356_19930 [Oleiphilus sp.]|nr:MAG: hypothetical protein C9356_19930 [Oleiphilus sp.]
MGMQLSQEAVQKANEEYQVMLQSKEQSMLVDSIVTPFFLGMKNEGFSLVMSQSDCMILRPCPTCRGSYSGKYERDSQTYWGCPHCNEIVDD